jgi:hypothetical protein
VFDPYAELKAVVRRLEADGIAYALCGALALAVHGAPRATNDIDVLARPADLDRVIAIARGLGFTHTALPMTFADGTRMRRFTKIVDGRALMLDVLLVHEALEPVFQDRARLVWDGEPLQVVTRDGLIVLKTTAGRPQDLVDIQRLMELERDGR